MTRVFKKKKEDIGLSPYALIFRGQKKIDKVVVNAMDYSLNSVNEFEVVSADQFNELKNHTTTSWLNVYGIDNVKLMEVLSDKFQISNIILSDIMNPNTRPKFIQVDHHLYINVKLLHKNDIGISIDNLSLVISDGLLISFQEKVGNIFDPIRERIRTHKNKIRKSGSDYLAFALLDVVVDSYIYQIGELGERIEDLEELLSENMDKYLPDQINSLKRELNAIRKIVKPTKEMLLGLAKYETDLIKDDNIIHYKELVDNINEANDLVDSYREILYDMLNIYHTNVSNRLNEIMRLLTIISVIFIPITFIAGVYGTNFDVLPELHWKYGYFAMLSIMAIVVLGMIWYFKRKKWF